MMNVECRTEALPAIYSGGQTAVQAKTRLNRAAKEPEDSVRGMRMETGKMITNEHGYIQPYLSQLLLAWKS
jgi:hypothetical protein